MAEFPALPLWTDAFIGDTTHLTAAQTGAYIMLMLVAWRTHDCTLPDDDVILARYARMSHMQWKCNRITIMSFFQKDSNGKWFQKRLSSERDYVAARVNKNKMAANARWLKNKDTGNATAYANAMPKRCEPIPTPTPIVKERDKESLSKKSHKMPFDDLPFEWRVWVVNEKGWDDSIIADIWSLFREYWKNGKGRNTKRDEWSATWRTWCRKDNTKSQGELYGRAKHTKLDLIAEGVRAARAERERDRAKQT